MKSITFQHQILFGLLFVVAGFVCSAIFKNGIFSNIGWVIYGCLFLLNPVCPIRTAHVKNIKIYIRIAGAAVILLGVLTRFGV